jgi:hypothetical protein
VRRGAGEASEHQAVDQLIATRLQQSFYAAASRYLSQISGAVLLLLADRNRQRLDRLLPAIIASAAGLRDHLAMAEIPPASQRLLQEISERLSVILVWLQQPLSVEKRSDREITASLAELRRLREMLLSAGKRSCHFTMLHFAAGCCCGQHDAPPPEIDLQ